VSGEGDAPVFAPAAPQDRAMMRLALAQARRAMELDETPVGAVVYELATGAALALAHNRRELDADPTAHAELLAMRKAAQAVGDWRLSHCGLAVTLEPCAMCAGAIVNARVGRLVFGALDPKAGAVASLYAVCSDDRLNHRPVVVEGVCAEASAALLRSFFRSKRRPPGSPGPAGR